MRIYQTGHQEFVCPVKQDSIGTFRNRCHGAEGMDRVILAQEPLSLHKWSIGIREKSDVADEDGCWVHKGFLAKKWAFSLWAEYTILF
jgi:hypothetical protein